MKFSYLGFERVKKFYSQSFGILGWIIFTAFGIFIWSGITHIPASETNPNPLDDPRYTLVCFGLWFIIVSSIICSAFLNFLPTIWVEEAGLTIDAFLFLKIKIPWSDVIDIREGVTLYNYTLVRAKKITFFHRFIGFLYSQTFYPGFLISPGIEDRNYLLQEIRRGIRRSRIAA